MKSGLCWPVGCKAYWSFYFPYRDFAFEVRLQKHNASAFNELESRKKSIDKLRSGSKFVSLILPNVILSFIKFHYGINSIF
jgi:hypothetical protein